jgi:hypothetical protein
MLNLWFLLINLAALVLTILAFPKSTVKTSAIVFLSVVFLALGIYTLIHNIQLRGLLAWIQIRRHIGIHGVYRRGDQRNGKLINRISSSHHLHIMALSGVFLIPHFKDAITTALVEKNCCLKVLIAQRESDFVKEVETLEGLNRTGQISTDITHTKARLKEIISEAHQKNHLKSQSIGRIWLGTYNTMLRSSLIICDNSWAWYTPNLPPKRAMESVSMEISQAPNGLLRDCIGHFAAVWNWCKDNSRIEEITINERDKK